MAADEDLACEQFAVALLDLEVDVRGRPARIRNRLDGPEPVATLGVRGETAVALEILVLLLLLRPAVGGVEVHRVGVALPDFDQGILDRLAARIQDATGQVSNLPD